MPSDEQAELNRVVNALVERHAKLLDTDKEKTGKEFLAAIERQINIADPEGIQPLLTYVKEAQIAGRIASDALAKLVKEKAASSSSLSETEKAVLKYWSEDREATIDKVVAKFGEGLAPADKKVVDDWLKVLTERERSLVTAGAVVGRDIDAGLFLAVNLYRARVAGLTREKLLSTLKMCQIYCGLPAYVAASQTLVVMEKVIGAMKSDATPADVIDRLVQRFDTSL